jgi:hypothetical protein
MKPSRDGRGERFYDPSNPTGSYVRIERDPENDWHVHVTAEGRAVSHDLDSHIPFDVWDRWNSFGAP